MGYTSIEIHVLCVKGGRRLELDVAWTRCVVGSSSGGGGDLYFVGQVCSATDALLFDVVGL